MSDCPNSNADSATYYFVTLDQLLPPHFIDEEGKMQRLKSREKFTQLGSSLVNLPVN